MCLIPRPTPHTSAAQSVPGGAESSPRRPSTLSTSRKLRPTARTRSFTPPSSGWVGGCQSGTTHNLSNEPRASKCSVTGPAIECGASASRGTRHVASSSTASGSLPTSGSPEAWRGAVNPVGRTVRRPAPRHCPVSSHSRWVAGASRRAERASPIAPACKGRTRLAADTTCAPLVIRERQAEPEPMLHRTMLSADSRMVRAQASPSAATNRTSAGAAPVGACVAVNRQGAYNGVPPHKPLGPTARAGTDACPASRSRLSGSTGCARWSRPMASTPAPPSLCGRPPVSPILRHSVM
eukprot:scaffold25783_cov118-Isochrysis_galbana.AAC.1